MSLIEYLWCIPSEIPWKLDVLIPVKTYSSFEGEDGELDSSRSAWTMSP